MIAAGVLFVIAAAAGTYAWFLADEANLARQEAVRTQMKFLADLSRQETEQGDPGTGLLLALEALLAGGYPEGSVLKVSVEGDGFRFKS